MPRATSQYIDSQDRASQNLREEVAEIVRHSAELQANADRMVSNVTRGRHNGEDLFGSNIKPKTR